MRKTLTTVALASLLVVGLVMSAAGPVSAEDETTWYFSGSDGESTEYYPSFATSYVRESYAGPNHFMSRVGAGSGGSIFIGAGEAVTWIADEAASVHVSFPAGNWNGNLAILGEDGGTCSVEIGRWVSGDDGRGCFTACGSGTRVDFSGTGGWGGHCDNPFTVCPGAFDIGQGERLACRITGIHGWTDIHCGGDSDYDGHCCIGCPRHRPVDPVPELPTVALLGMGLVGVTGIVGLSLLRRRSQAQ
jgi:hypothetical protein